ncbi:MAG: DUF4249 domain-containing protein [Saprospiraceae bacterium]
MNKFKLGLIAIAIITVFASCEDMFRGAVLEVELPEHESKLAPYAFFKDTDSTLIVKVGKSVGVLDSINPDIVLDATVELYKNGSLEYTFTYNQDIVAYEIYLGEPFSPSVGDEYELRVTKEGFETASATQIVPSPVQADSVEYVAQGGVDPFGDPLDVINVTFTDPADARNFYEFGGFFNIKYTDPFDTTFVDEYQYSLYFDSNDPNFENGALSDAAFDGQQYTIRLETYSAVWGDPTNFEITGQLNFSSTTSEYATFIKSLNDYWDAEGNPFSEPVILYSNTSTGLGVFGLLVTDTFEF